MDAPTLNDDYLDMIEALQASKVDFIIVGAHALAAHGLPRATGDIDIFVRCTKDNASRVMSALRIFGAPIDSHGVTQNDFEQPDTVYQIGLPPRRIDLLTTISGVSFEEAWQSRLTTRLGNLEVPTLGREALLKNKRATGRDKDLLDARALEKHGFKSQ